MSLKYYLSMMYIRMAFSIIAHLTQELLLLDEVIAVGDARIQKIEREDERIKPQRCNDHFCFP